jgi:hypothetical protein
MMLTEDSRNPSCRATYERIVEPEDNDDEALINRPHHQIVEALKTKPSEVRKRKATIEPDLKLAFERITLTSKTRSFHFTSGDGMVDEINMIVSLGENINNTVLERLFYLINRRFNYTVDFLKTKTYNEIITMLQPLIERPRFSDASHMFRNFTDTVVQSHQSALMGDVAALDI